MGKAAKKSKKQIEEEARQEAVQLIACVALFFMDFHPEAYIV
jgi:hypothetical protein